MDWAGEPGSSPPIFLSVIRDARGWPVSLIATAVTIHFLTGALAAANLPALHQAFGRAAVTKLCAVLMAAGLFNWSIANERWQLFAAAVMTGAGWSGMSAAALNAIVSPWFDRRRPVALAMAYNGGSIGVFFLRFGLSQLTHWVLRARRSSSGVPLC